MIGISNIISQGFSAFQERFDGIQNLLTGQGVGKYDPTQGSYVLPRRFLNQQEQSNIMQYGLMRKIVFKIPEGATAKWGRPTLTKGDPKTIAAISKALEDLQVIVPGNLPTTGADNAFFEALWRAFQSGNGAIVIHVDEGKDNVILSEPLVLKNVKAVTKLVVMDRYQLWPSGDLGNLGEITHFETDKGSKIHASRVLWFAGEKLDRLSKEQNNYCDDSILDGIYDCFVQYCGGVAGAARMLHDFDVIDIAVKGLWEANEKTAAIVQQRSTQNVQMQSIYRARMRDMDREAITHSTRAVGGYADLMDVLKEWMLANTPYPPAILFGEFSSGLSASGKSQEEKALWDETRAEVQKRKLHHLLIGNNPAAPGLLQIVCASKDGPTKSKMPEGLNWEWLPLFSPSPLEQAELENQRASIAMQYEQVVPGFAANAVLSHYGGTVYNPTITITSEFAKSVTDSAKGITPEQEAPIEEELPLEDTENVEA